MKCDNCHRDFTPKRSNAKFCSNTCRSKFWNNNHKQPAPSQVDLKASLRGILAGSSVSNEDEGGAKGRTETIHVENPEYKSLKMRLDTQKFALNQSQRDIQQLQQQVQDLSRDTEAMAGLVGMGCGAVLAGKAGAGTLGIIAAAGISSVVFDRLAKKGRDERIKAKEAKIVEIQGKISKKNIDQSYLQSEIKRLSQLLLRIPATISKEIPAPVPVVEVIQGAIAIQAAVEDRQQKPLPLKQTTHTPTSKKVINSKELSLLSFLSFDFKGEWLEFLGNPKVDFFCVIHGKPGQGKSTFGIAFAKYLSENFGRVLYISAEEGISLTLKNKIISTGATSEGLDFADISRYEDIAAEVPTDEYNFIFIDSLDRLRMGPVQVKEFRERYKDSAIIAICQSTKNGAMRGSQEIAHDDDITISVDNGVAITTKNRFNMISKEYRIF